MSRRSAFMVATLLALFLVMVGCATTGGGLSAEFVKRFNEYTQPLTLSGVDAGRLVRDVRADSTRNRAGFDACRQKYDFARKSVDRFVATMQLDLAASASPDTAVYNSLARDAAIAARDFTAAANTYLGRHNAFAEVLVSAPVFVDALKNIFSLGAGRSQARLEYMQQRLEMTKWKGFYAV